MATDTVYSELANYTVFPTENDHYGTTIGEGRIIQELTLAPILGRGGADNMVLSGFTMPTSGTRANHIHAGTAIINGYYITGTDNINVTFGDTKVTMVYLQLEYDAGSKVLRPVLLLNPDQPHYGHADPVIPSGSTFTMPSNSILLGRVTTNATDVTFSQDFRPRRQIVAGFFEIGTGGSNLHFAYIKTGNASWSYTAPTLTVTFNHPYFQEPIVISEYHDHSGPTTSMSMYVATDADHLDYTLNDESDTWSFVCVG